MALCRLPPRSLLLSPPHSIACTANGDAAAAAQPAATRARLRRLCKEGRLASALLLLEGHAAHNDDAPKAAESTTSTVLWNTLLIAYVSRFLADHALRLYTRMNRAGAAIPSDAFTYSSALAACARSQRLRHGRSIHCHILRRLRIGRRIVLLNSLLHMYAACGAIAAARVVFDAMPVRNVVSWNTLIAWSARSGRHLNALHLLLQMLQDGITPTTVSFVSAFPAAATAGGRKFAQALFGSLLKYGPAYFNDPYVISSAIGMLAAIGDVNSARLVFDRATVKNIEVWNALMTGFIQNGQFIDAIHLFYQVLEEESSSSVVADTVTFLSALSAISHLRDIDLGRQLHSFLVKQGLSPQPVILTNSVIVMYSRCGHIQSAFEVFSQMPKRDLVSWNTMATAFVHNGMDMEGLLLIYEMQKNELSIDIVTVTALLSIASNLRNVELGGQTHAYIIRQGLHSKGIESYLIDMYSKCGLVEVAQILFDSVDFDDRDDVTWNALIAGYAQNERAQQALAVFREMLKKGLQPNSVTLSSVLPACELIGGLQLGRQIHCFALRHGLNDNIFVDTAIVDMYAKCGEIATAEHVFNGMPEKSIVSYTAMISGLGQHGLGTEALALFRLMLDSGTTPDGHTFLATITACSYCGLVDEGLDLYNLMENFSIVATPEHHCCIVDLLCRAGRVEDAYAFVLGLVDSNSDSIRVWESLLGACKAYGKLELGSVVFKRLVEIDELGEYTGKYNVTMSNLYATGSNWSHVEQFWGDSRDSGICKKPGYSWIAVEDGSRD